MRITNVFDLTGSVGAIVSAMGCASCFPAIATLGASIGLGFLSQYESLFINALVPVFATVVLLTNLLAWLAHRYLLRMLAGITGPAMVLATLYLFWTDDWSTYLFYAGLAAMMAVSIWDLVSPVSRHCQRDETT